MQVTGEFPHKGQVTRKMFPFDYAIMCKYYEKMISRNYTQSLTIYMIPLYLTRVQNITLIKFVGFTREVYAGNSLRWKYLKQMLEYWSQSVC